MKAKVVRRFRDILTQELHEIDSVYEGTEDRVKQLQEKGYLGTTIEVKKKRKRKTDGEGE
jgi:hypothetical protein